MISNLTIRKKRFTLCNKSEELQSGHFELKDGINIEIFFEINGIAEVWDTLSLQEHFASSAYLRTIEKDSPENLQHIYVLIKRDNVYIGCLLLQSLVLNFNDSFNYENYTTNRTWASKTWQRLRQKIVGSFKFRMLTVGNLYLTGQYGFNFIDNSLALDWQFLIVNDIILRLKKELCATSYRFSGVLMKDYFEGEELKDPSKFGFTPFEIDPNMILNLRKSWNSFDDYLLDMRSKYRIRMKNALKKFKGIERRKLELTDIIELNSNMYQLYSEILEGSGFVLVKGEKEYFINLKQELKDNLRVVGYFLKDELVGFYSWTLDNKKMDSHFIGVKSNLNLRHQIYLNILMDLVKDAIHEKAETLYYFRTALEIKSSVGAIPYRMLCYFRHNSSLINRLIPIIFKYFVPQQHWKQRHPFKSMKD